MNWPLLLSIFGVLLAFAALMFVYVRKSDQAASKNLAERAQKLGLTFEKGSFKHEPSLTGTFKSFPIVVQSVVTSSGSSLMYTTNYAVTLIGEHIPPDLIVYRERFLSKISKAFGGEDIQIDDPELDKAFIIKGIGADPAQLFFARPEVKSCFLEMVEKCDNFRLENRTLNFEFPHRLLEVGDRLDEYLNRVIGYAQIINGGAANARQASKIPADPNDLLGESTTLEVFMPMEHENTLDHEHTLS